jgi:hypothetical protein
LLLCRVVNRPEAITSNRHDAEHKSEREFGRVWAGDPRS